MDCSRCEPVRVERPGDQYIAMTVFFHLRGSGLEMNSCQNSSRTRSRRGVWIFSCGEVLEVSLVSLARGYRTMVLISLDNNGYSGLTSEPEPALPLAKSGD
jgi:hypothetical protein